MDPESDKKISEHVLRMHKYRNPGEQDGDPLPFGDSSETLSTYNTDHVEQEEETEIYAKKDTQLYGERDKQEQFVSVQFMKKYVHVAKNIKPTLSQEAADMISGAYTELRHQDTDASGQAKTAPITARTLETLIRLSSAHAKARMSKVVEEVDADAAIEMVQFAYFHKVETKPKKKSKKDQEESDEEEDEDNEKTADKPEKKQTKRQKEIEDKEKEGVPLSMKKRKVGPGEEGYDPYDFDSQGVEGPVSGTRRKSKTKMDETMETAEATPVSLTEERLQIFRSTLQGVFSEKHAQTLPFTDITDRLKKDYPDAKFSSAEVDAAVHRMTEDNQIMLSDGTVFLV